MSVLVKLMRASWNWGDMLEPGSPRARSPYSVRGRWTLECVLHSRTLTVAVMKVAFAQGKLLAVTNQRLGKSRSEYHQELFGRD